MSYIDYRLMFWTWVSDHYYKNTEEGDLYWSRTTHGFSRHTHQLYDEFKKYLSKPPIIMKGKFKK